MAVGLWVEFRVEGLWCDHAMLCGMHHIIPVFLPLPVPTSMLKQILFFQVHESPLWSPIVW